MSKLDTVIEFLDALQPLLLQIAMLGFLIATFVSLGNGEDGRALIYSILLIATELARIGDKLEKNDE
jgi:hypothetical protein